MNRKKWIAAALALLLTLSLSPAALAMDTLLPSGWEDWIGYVPSLRDMIDVNKGHVDLAGSSFQLQNLLFIEDAVLDEETELCLCETTKNAMILDETALPDGLTVKLRHEAARIPDGKDGEQVADELRREQMGLDPAEEPTLDPADRDREAWYLYLVGKPKKTGEFIFVLWDGTIRVCSVTVLTERPEPSAKPQSGGEQQQGGASQGGDSGMTSEWVDNNDEPMTLPGDNDAFSGQPGPSDVNEVLQGAGTDTSSNSNTNTNTNTNTDTGAGQSSTPSAPTAQVPELPAPTVSISGGSTAYTNDRAVLEARVTNGFNLQYQWYIGLGSGWELIKDGTGNSATYRPDTSHAGTYAYLCRVYSSGYGQETYADSAPVTFTVTDRPVATPTPTPVPNKTISAVSVAKLPNKVEYNDGETVDPTGLMLRVRYSDGSSEVVDSGFYVSTSTVSYNSTGLANVSVNYKGYQTSFQVKVKSLADLVRGIGVLTMPNKSTYAVGDYLDTTGLSIRVYSYDGRYLDVSEGFECSPTRFNYTGNQTVTVSFMGKTCTFTVVVQDARRVTSLTIQSLPANRSYTVGDAISTAGLVLQLQTTSGTETVTSGFSISPRIATTAGSQQITVSYEGLSTSYTVDVRSNIPAAAQATPTPTPWGTTPTPVPFGASPSPLPFGSVSPSPAFPSPSPSVSPTPTPIHTPTPARRNTGVSTLVKVLFGVAVLALGGLVGYVIYLRKSGVDEEEFLDEPSFSEKLHNIFKKKK